MSSSDSVEMTIEEINKVILPKEPKQKLPKLAKKDRIDHLSAQVEHISSFIQNFMTSKTYEDRDLESEVDSEDGEMHGDRGASTSLGMGLVNPSQGKRELNLSMAETTCKEPTIPTADVSRVKKIEGLQHFGSPEWNEVRYGDVVRRYLANPMFNQLEVNGEFLHLNKSEQYAGSLDKFCGALSHALLQQNECLRKSLQELVNWSAEEGKELTAGSLFKKVELLFAPDTEYQAVTKDVLQMVCGRRANAIHHRRDAILNEVKSRYIREAVKNIPPAAGYLFDPSKLESQIQRMGGLDKCLPHSSFDPQPSTSTQLPKYKGPVRKPFRESRPFREGRMFRDKPFRDSKAFRGGRTNQQESRGADKRGPTKPRRNFGNKDRL